MMNKYQKVLIKDKLKDMKYKHLHNEIIKILLSDDKFIYTTNMNGLYFDINKLDDDTLITLSNILNLQSEKIKKLEYTEKYSNEDSEVDKLQNNLRKLKIFI